MEMTDLPVLNREGKEEVIRDHMRGSECDLTAEGSHLIGFEKGGGGMVKVGRVVGGEGRRRDAELAYVHGRENGKVETNRSHVSAEDYLNLFSSLNSKTLRKFKQRDRTGGQVQPGIWSV